MKIKYVLWIITIVILGSCDKNNADNECNYSLLDYPQDTSLFISYEINSKEYKYYQQLSPEVGFSPLEIDNSSEFRYYCRNITFDLLFTDEEYYNRLHPAGSITFWNYIFGNKMTNEEFFNFYNLNNPLSKEIKDSYKFTSPKDISGVDLELQDSALFRGVEVMGFATNVYKHFNYDTTLINQFMTDDSYFKVTGIEKVCPYYHKISGVFSMKSFDKNDTIYIKNGKFSFISK